VPSYSTVSLMFMKNPFQVRRLFRLEPAAENQHSSFDELRL
jgi:hypothetical protein